MADEVNEVRHSVDDDAVELLHVIVTAAIHLSRVARRNAVVDIAGGASRVGQAATNLASVLEVLFNRSAALLLDNPTMMDYNAI